ncbi:MAG: type II toxin-antitoxin system prevent-host-death family antitoxin [Microbacteriaceae bacterium]|nr:MAG: type II toxin-antitoxin system prevent-host-death family antitoxin [Microbacteriaceae bacterium]
MVNVSARDLRNHTAEVLRTVESGERVIITSYGVPAAEVVPVSAAKRAGIRRADLLRILSTPADAGLREDLAMLAGDTTDDLGPIR